MGSSAPWLSGLSSPGGLPEGGAGVEDEPVQVGYPPVFLLLGHALKPGVISEGSPHLPSPAPSFLRELVDETVVLGQSVTLTCQVSAQPAAQATWNKGKELSWCWGDGDRKAGDAL